jgi:hypothetical protein
VVKTEIPDSEGEEEEDEDEEDIFYDEEGNVLWGETIVVNVSACN